MNTTTTLKADFQPALTVVLYAARTVYTRDLDVGVMPSEYVPEEDQTKTSPAEPGYIAVAPEDPTLAMQTYYYPLSTYAAEGDVIHGLEVAILGPQLLTLRYWREPADEEPFRPYLTYSGPFAVHWPAEEV